MNKIGDFEFLKFSVKPTRPAAQWERIVRPGVDGVALWNTGARADVLEIQTWQPTLTMDAAQQLYRDYVRLTSLPAVRVEFADRSEPATLYKVLSVKPLAGQVRALLRGHYAGLPANYRGWCCCDWQLQPIAV